jgi:acetolactate synthase-1/2/3 large subunit
VEALTGGELVVKTLADAGVDVVFGVISIHNIPIYDAMQRLGGIRPVQVRHEQAALLMADGYARATGRLGVALTSTGPGAGNAMGAMIEAYTAGSPILHITGQIETRHLGKEKGFIHEMKDQLAMLGASSKWVGHPMSTAEIPSMLSAAIRNALTGRRRPVAVEIPIDLQYFAAEAPAPTPTDIATVAPGRTDLAAAAKLIESAQRPIIWAGGGVIAADAAVELTKLAERIEAGVITSICGRGAMPEDHPLCLGPLALEQEVRELLESADLLLAVGTRFQGPNTRDWRLKIPPTLVHIDVDPAEIGRNYSATIGLAGDAKMILTALLAAIEGGAVSADWGARIRQVRQAARDAVRARLGPYERIMDDLRAGVTRDAIIVKDATIPAYAWGNRILEVYEPRTSIHSTSAAIGPGLPLALGAACGLANRQVVLIAGDGGFVLNIAELGTAAQEHLKVLMLVFNDGGYGILRLIQDQEFAGRRTAVDIKEPDFVKLSEAYGIPGERVDKAEAFAPALSRALAAGGPALIEIDCRRIGPMKVPYQRTSSAPVRANTA